TMLRLALLDNLRRLAGQVVRTRGDRAVAEAWAKAGGATPLPDRPPSDAYVAGLLHALRDHDPAADPAARAVEDWLSGHGLTSATAAPAADERRRHVGFHLIDEGRRPLEAELGYRPRWGDAFRRALTDRPQTFYFGALAAVTGGLLAALGLALGAGPGPTA